MGDLLLEWLLSSRSSCFVQGRRLARFFAFVAISLSISVVHEMQGHFYNTHAFLPRCSWRLCKSSRRHTRMSKNFGFYRFFRWIDAGESIWSVQRTPEL